MKRKLACLLSLVLLVLLMACPASAADSAAPAVDASGEETAEPIETTEIGFKPLQFSIAAAGAYVVNLDTNIILFEQNSETQVMSASLVKMMTCLLLLQDYQDSLDTISCTAPAYIYDILYGKNASTADILSGETHTLRQLLYAMLLPSANEAAYIVADYMSGGDVDSFVARMNTEARKIGCTGTVFTDPCGLDEGNLTTARDMYLILRAAMAYDAFVEVCGTNQYDMGENERYTAGTYIIYNTDRMISASLGGEFYRSYTQGGKTGTLEDWQNFAGWHTQNGETYISVVLNSPNSVEPYDYPTDRPALYETGLLMDWVYKYFSVQTALDVSMPINETRVKYSTQGDTVQLYPADGICTILPVIIEGEDATENAVKDVAGVTTEKVYHLPEYLAAPVKKGEVVGSMTLYFAGHLLGTVDLVAGRDLSLNPVLYALEKIGEFFGSMYFRVLLIGTLLMLGFYLALFYSAQNKRRQAKQHRR